eukprot:CAMPEP_0183376016 /NCGR_PEP_ID=MMETSP0164_2-20130417/119035_1 /TAXON_ID=221442 /ORGANISM="Coccolithus pelagicus ssp braarudi, Strain PLY182g" /LENGTH=61 /DNA_ID=CAMNT_0025553251 /DNA_START=152 /DNA_END=338 /DNA_ORIENTATION=-
MAMLIKARVAIPPMFARTRRAGRNPSTDSSEGGCSELSVIAQIRRAALQRPPLEDHAQHAH